MVFHCQHRAWTLCVGVQASYMTREEALHHQHRDHQTYAGPTDICLSHQWEEQLCELKQELSNLSKSFVPLDLDDKDEMTVLQATLNTVIFDNSLKIKRLLEKLAIPATTDSRGVKLPKIDVPAFNGNILYWKSFWGQFAVAVHTRTNISDTEKLVYLRHSVKEGSAKHVIEGLSREGLSCVHEGFAMLVLQTTHKALRPFRYLFLTSTVPQPQVCTTWGRAKPPS